jgi:hypothetical protein
VHSSGLPGCLSTNLMTGCLPVSWGVILADGAATSGTDSTGTVAALEIRDVNGAIEVFGPADPT